MKKITFIYGGRSQDYNVTFEIAENGNLYSKCSCTSKKPCKHIQHLLIGRTEKVYDDQAQLLRDFTHQLSRSEEGRNAIDLARKYFQEETSCRRCNSTNIVDTKQKSFSSRFYSLISKHRYYCKDCKWSW